MSAGYFDFKATLPNSHNARALVKAFVDLVELKDTEKSLNTLESFGLKIKSGYPTERNSVVFSDKDDEIGFEFQFGSELPVEVVLDLMDVLENMEIPRLKASYFDSRSGDGKKWMHPKVSLVDDLNNWAKQFGFNFDDIEQHINDEVMSESDDEIINGLIEVFSGIGGTIDLSVEENWEVCEEFEAEDFDDEDSPLHLGFLEVNLLAIKNSDDGIIATIDHDEQEFNLLLAANDGVKFEANSEKTTFIYLAEDISILEQLALVQMEREAFQALVKTLKTIFESA